MPPPVTRLTLGQARQRLFDLVDRSHGRRFVLGVAGEPGAGKTTMAQRWVDELNAAAVPTVRLPMDGFHLADVELERLGSRARKGAIDTFDAHGYLSLLRRVREDDAAIVYAPSFERDLQQPIAGAVAVLPEHRVVISEGNYLLDLAPPWPQIAEVFDEVWAVHTPQRLRLERLVARHVEFGKSPHTARTWVETVDEGNAERIRQHLHRAQASISMT